MPLACYNVHMTPDMTQNARTLWYALSGILEDEGVRENFKHKVYHKLVALDTIIALFSRHAVELEGVTVKISNYPLDEHAYRSWEFDFSSHWQFMLRVDGILMDFNPLPLSGHPVPVFYPNDEAAQDSLSGYDGDKVYRGCEPFVQGDWKNEKAILQFAPFVEEAFVRVQAEVISGNTPAAPKSRTLARL